MIIEGINSHLNNLGNKLMLDIKATLFFDLKNYFETAFLWFVMMTKSIYHKKDD